MKFLPYFIFLISLTAIAQETAVNWDETSINNKLTLTISKRDLEAIYKKDYTITDPVPEFDTCGTKDEANVKMLNYKGVVFELDNNMLNFRRVVFQKKPNDVFLTYKDIRFDERMTLDTFKKLFANAEKTQENMVNNGTYIVMSVPDAQSADDSWEFHFLKGKLQSVWYKFSCN
jgi:hypothetical protein